jgi:H+/Cl- antiporter ClcA
MPVDSPAVRLVLIALLVGIADALLFLGFEWVVHHGTDWLWNDVAGTDEVRWRLVPLAIGLSIAFSALLRAFGERRFVEPHLDPLEDSEPGSPPTTAGLATVLLLGAASLLAGASLGPEATLAAAAGGLGGWAVARAELGPEGRVLILASVGALLVAFFASLVVIAIPVLVLWQRAKSAASRPGAAALAAIVAAGVAAWLTLWLVRGELRGYGEVPSDAVHARDYLSALALGAVAVGVGGLLRSGIRWLAHVARALDAVFPWWLGAAAAGAVLGALYLLGGPAVQFSGNEGTAILLSGEPHYGPWALAGIALVKLAVTAWSLAAGYRGGLVFPSLLVGVAVSLFAADELPGLAGPGLLVGCLAGLLVAMTAPLVGAVMVLAVLPPALLPLGLAGAAGAVCARRAHASLK